ncbi:hypothetical protein HDU91_002984 [Kappamyces sp. JEL0680]|nr:hypothetical protein HDU91_002984 [Kappamyces sp. JEL0680]
MVDSVFSFYLLDFLVFSVGMEGSTAGYILLSSECFNVLVGPLSSYIMDHYFWTGVGQHRFWMFVTLPFLVMSFIGIWWIPAISREWHIVYYTAMLLLFNAAYGNLLIAYEGCITNMFESNDDLSKVNSYRLFVGSVSSIVAVLLGTLLSPLPANTRFLILSSSICAIVLTSYLVFLLFIREVNENTPMQLKRAESDLTIVSDAATLHESWFHRTARLFRHKTFLVLILSHFLLWVIIISVHSSIQAFVRDYLALDAALPWAVTPSTLAVLVMQTGTATVQMLMGVYTKQLEPSMMVRFALLVLAIGSLLFAFWFQIPGMPLWTVFPLSFVSGMGIGALFTSYEIMVPQVILHLQTQFHEGEQLENLIYGMVDSIRELSLALSFLACGLILDRLETSLAVRINCGLMPLLICVFCLGVHLYHPHIILVQEPQDTAVVDRL